MSAEPSPSPGVLRAEEIRAGYGAGDIIHGVSLSVAPRTVASVVGPNGSGKSTQKQAIQALVHPREFIVCICTPYCGGNCTR